MGPCEQVEVCCNGETIQCDPAVADIHVSHGDTLGACEPETVDVCCNASGTPETITVSPEEAAIHLAHGDTEGPCEPPPVVADTTTDETDSEETVNSE